ncbi:sigma-70 family RNA polymerase sigma factor [Nocardioides zeae]|uniref:Sigma-70 family RNA polymerase sigma factor n=1 Tax=Nocardioides imazamoxiresistens TaxID=3231893 RepID=A0ABU3PRF1_9ACTN|nr:sigma-70 family RNA polymerase sigma factor [Nocardioides zeae]MDT9591788.1 sigma-70 family RNA polymerase sigma factor [Nocardioides zeae]
MADLDLAEAHRLHAPELLGFALNALRDRGTAEECVQDTFTRAWQARERYDPRRAGVRTWLFAIARNVVVDHVRARDRRARRSLVAVGSEEAAHPGHAETVEDRVTLVWALAQLSEEHRAVVVAVRLEQLTYAEVAEREGVPIATLRTRMYHALRAMRRLLEDADRTTGGEDAR